MAGIFWTGSPAPTHAAAIEQRLCRFPRVLPESPGRLEPSALAAIGNVILGAATVVMTFVIARMVARDAWTPSIAAASVAFLPAFVFLSGFVKNDNLEVFLGGSSPFCALRFSRSMTTAWMIATGAVFGLLLTTKLSVVPLALVVPFLAFIGSSSWGRRFSLFAIGCASGLAVSAWYLIQNWVRYGDPDAGHASLAYMTRLGSLGTPIGVPYVVRNPLDLSLQSPREDRLELLVRIWLGSVPLAVDRWLPHHARRSARTLWPPLRPRPQRHRTAGASRPWCNLGPVTRLRVVHGLSDPGLRGSICVRRTRRNGHCPRTCRATLARGVALALARRRHRGVSLRIHQDVLGVHWT